jgi:hypothetical protein
VCSFAEGPPFERWEAPGRLGLGPPLSAPQALPSALEPGAHSIRCFLTRIAVVVVVATPPNGTAISS